MLINLHNRFAVNKKQHGWVMSKIKLIQHWFNNTEIVSLKTTFSDCMKMKLNICQMGYIIIQMYAELFFYSYF